MKRFKIALFFGVLSTPPLLEANPTNDLNAFRRYFKNHFPTVPSTEYGNGVYAINADAREQWLDIEEFPPYEHAVDEGKILYQTPFANGQSYSDCFPQGSQGIRHQYPYFDLKTAQVKTLELDINQCREKNGEPPLDYLRGDLAKISAYMAYVSRGKAITINIPNHPLAIAAYERGKQYYYSRRGQLNFSCASCHVSGAGQRLRADTTSLAIGQTTHFPVYRSKWGEIGTLHRRYMGCNKQVRAIPLAPQSQPYRELEYFHTYMNYGLKMNGPGARK